MSTNHYLQMLKASTLGRYANIPRRSILASRYLGRPIAQATRWVFQSKEDTNLTYPLTDANINYLAHFLSLATNTPATIARTYIEEIQTDDQLKTHVINSIKSSPYRSFADLRCDFGRRIGWYALVRILKPKVIVETGIDKGFGSVALCAAILRNGDGAYYGTDINLRAGYLLSGPYATVGTILYGDSISSLKKFNKQIDFFVNDSDHSADYERKEYDVVFEKLTPEAIVIADNAHATTALLEWSELHHRRFMFWHEQPKNHWYPGGGIGLSLHS